MNDNGIITTFDEIINFGISDYEYLETPGEYAAILRHRAWGNKGSLACCFETDDGTKFRLYVWSNVNKDGLHYCPKKSSIDFRYVKDGTRWKITAALTRTGKVKWDLAEQI